MARTLENEFELSLNFEGNKNPSQAFNQLAGMYDKLYEIDEFVLYSIVQTAKVEYELIDIEFGSIKSKVIQFIKAIPDDVLKDVLNPTKWPGHALVFIKHRILKAAEQNEVQSKQSLEKVTEDVNRKIREVTPPNSISLEVHNYFILNVINEIDLHGQRLKNNESYEFKSDSGNAKITNKCNVDMAKLLAELGSQTTEQTRVETLKVKSLELLSDKTTWKLIRLKKQINVKILDLEFLHAYHDRQKPILPNDYLKLELKIIYTNTPNSVKPEITYEALKIFEVIQPDQVENDNQNELFE